MLNVFKLASGRLFQEEIDTLEGLRRVQPVWVDLDAPTLEEKGWIAEHFGLTIPSDAVDDDLEESARFYEGKMALTQYFPDADDLVRKTPDFWTTYVLPKINNEFWELHRFLNRPYPNGPNEYLQRVEANIEKVRRQVGVSQ